MKKFKIGFLAIIAVLAMSFTVAEQQGAFKKDASKDIYACKTSDFADLTFTTPSGTITAPNNVSCNATYCADPASFSNPTASDPIQCTASNNEFCCAQVLISPDCTTSPYTRQVVIHCKAE